ncbi:glycosyltransferase [Williamsia sp. D3]|uniref:glycosyltransferase n=1 Tax=Williamsia sp. D3 TaxID=1313067 RepID=UPI0003D32624|nr:glycosyltransferase [Williamsia sp. D3]ETD30523.1 glycosyl transferase [Williamsia sp. D3]
MSRPTVAILGTRGYPSFYGGFETLVRQLVPYMVECGWDVVVYGRTRDADASTEESVVVRVTRGLETKSLSTLSYGLTSALDARKIRPDVALIMNVANGYWLPFLRAKDIPAIVNVDGIEWERAKWGRLARSVFRLGARMTAKYSSSIICDSVVIKDYWAQNFGREGKYIPYGGTVHSELPPPDGLPAGKYILMVARFVPENTVPEFLAAAESLSDNSVVVIVGSSGYGGPLEEAVEGLAAKNSNVKWYGHINDDQKLFGLWQHAGVYFHGHSVGGTNPALVQAMACGAPIVARDTPYNREVLGDAGSFTRPDSESIREAIELALSDDNRLRSLRVAARERAASFYSWDAVCASYEAAARSAIGVRA